MQSSESMIWIRAHEVARSGALTRDSLTVFGVEESKLIQQTINNSRVFERLMKLSAYMFY